MWAPTDNHSKQSSVSYFGVTWSDHRTPMRDTCNLVTISMHGPQAFAVPLFADTHLNRWSCFVIKVWLRAIFEGVAHEFLG